MFVARLSLQNFRNFSNAEFSFQPGMNGILGPNGCGKSNLLEAIFFAATGRPSRAARDGELIRFGESVGRVEARTRKRVSEPVLEAALERVENFSARKTLKLNHQPVRKLSELIGEVKVVLFAPADHSLVSGEPSFRRRFLDLALSQISPAYLRHLQQYQAAKDQRNFLLKRPHASAELEPWNAQLVEFGSHLLLKRFEILPRLAFLATEAHGQLSESRELSFAYSASVLMPEEPIRLSASHAYSYATLADAFCKALDRTAREEAVRGMTLVGPHRDDFALFLDGVDARSFASQGEQKTIALSLKMGEGGLFEEQDGEPPIYLLDDCFSELDPERQQAVAALFLRGAQSLLTMSTAPSFTMEDANMIHLPAAEGAMALEPAPSV